MAKRNYLIILMLAMLASSSVFALNLGSSEVLNQVGEPLNIQVEVLRWETASTNRIDIEVGSPRDFAALGAFYSSDVDGLKLKLLEPTTDGKLILLITGRRDVNVDHLDLVLGLSYPGVDIRKKYRLVLQQQQQEPAQVISELIPDGKRIILGTPREVESRVIQPRLVEPKVSEPLMVEPLAEPILAEPLSLIADQAIIESALIRVLDDKTQIQNTIIIRSYMTQPGDTLLGIALEYLPAEENNRYQMLLGLHDMNPSAFVNNNITLLKSSQEILIPTKEDLASIDIESAQGVFEARWDQGLERFFAVTRR